MKKLTKKITERKKSAIIYMQGIKRFKEKLKTAYPKEHAFKVRVNISRKSMSGCDKIIIIIINSNNNNNNNNNNNDNNNNK